LSGENKTVRIEIDPSAGFCWGVVRTIDIAEEEMRKSGKLHSLGPVIHNPTEVQRLEGLGLEVVSRDDFVRLKGQRVLIRAHGEPPSTYRLAQNHGVTLIDATCPVVAKVQERIRKFYDQGYQIVIFGKKDHAEVRGLVGHTNNEAVVIKSVGEIGQVNLRRKTVLFSQTTMDKQTFYEIAALLKEKIKEFVVGTFEESAIDFHAKDTICGQVSGRDKKLREFAARQDLVLFVAGRNSSNGKVLFEVCRSANPTTYFVEEETEIRREWFAEKSAVGISGATSTPQWLMERVKRLVEEMLQVPAEV
jgi:4-hydroxy-3-methylbut-2-enyl diphosphate reductase